MIMGPESKYVSKFLLPSTILNSRCMGDPQLSAFRTAVAVQPCWAASQTASSKWVKLPWRVKCSPGTWGPRAHGIQNWGCMASPLRLPTAPRPFTGPSGACGLLSLIFLPFAKLALCSFCSIVLLLHLFQSYTVWLYIPFGSPFIPQIAPAFPTPPWTICRLIWIKR